MNYNIIDSKDNNLIRHLNKIKTKKFSKQYGECFVQSEKVIVQLLAKKNNGQNFIIDKIFVEQGEKKFDYILNNVDKNDVFFISKSVSNHINELETTDGIYAIAKIPQREIETLNGKILVLDGIQDPTNFGAILRCALAFSYHTIITINSVYAFTPKVVRSSMGYVFDVNIVSVDISEFKELVKQNNLYLLGATASGKDVKNIAKKENFALVIGNEGRGISEEIEKLCDDFVAIKTENVESLNASVSAGILMSWL